MRTPILMTIPIVTLLLAPSVAHAVCPYIYQPVCAADWNRYVNACVANEAGTQPLEDGALIEIADAQGDVLWYWSTNDAFIDEAVQIANGASASRIPVLALVNGSFCSEPHVFYADAADAHWADAAMELCDANLDYIDDNLEQWMIEVGQWCPWQSSVRWVWDYR